MAEHKDCLNISLIHDIDNRLSVVETDVEYAKVDLKEIKNVCSNVQVHLAKQNGTLPRIEEKVNQTSEDIQQFGDRMSIIEQKGAVISVVGKVTWGIVGGVIVGTILIIIKILLGM